MVFSSIVFVFFFLPVFFLAYQGASTKYKNAVALIGSLLFYFWGAPDFFFILLASVFVDFTLARRFTISTDLSRRQRLFWVSVTANVLLLAYFKYANFFVNEINALLQHFFASQITWTNIALPIGISFLVFQKISYLVDVYRGITKPAERISEYTLYIMLFPQLIAGPIVRYHDICDQLRNRRFSNENFIDGFFRFTIGLGKKVLIADQLGEVADNIFALDGSARPVSFAWLGMLCYGLQIYFDFSGYSDMALGLARMMGFRLLENFSFPYIARSVTEFWRRWHISLSRWMREYLYIPLGGNRNRSRVYLNLWIVFLLSGLWHGANWTFIVWGAFHGFFLTLERLFLARYLEKLPAAISMLWTFTIIMFSWVLFRSETFSEALNYYGNLFGLQHAGIANPMLLSDVAGNRDMFVMVLAIVMVFLPFNRRVYDYSVELTENYAARYNILFKLGLAAIIFILSVSGLLNSGFHPFIYFRF